MVPALAGVVAAAPPLCTWCSGCSAEPALAAALLQLVVVVLVCWPAAAAAGLVFVGYSEMKGLKLEVCRQSWLRFGPCAAHNAWVNVLVSGVHKNSVHRTALHVKWLE